MTRHTVLYCGPNHADFSDLIDGMASQSTRLEAGCAIVPDPRADTRWIPAYTVPAALAVLDEQFVNLLVIDVRGGEPALAARMERVRSLLESLDQVKDPEQRYGFHRILVLLSGTASEAVDHAMVEIGGYGVRHVLHERPGDTDLPARALQRALDLMLQRAPARTALCAAGGGITAIFFELGALKCLDDCLPAGAIHELDMYFGISAGAVVTSLLASGFSPEEFMASIAQEEGGRLPFVDLSLLRLGHINTPDIRRRIRRGLRMAARSVVDSARGRTPPTLDGLFLQATALVGPPFQSSGYEAMLRRMLTTPGASNDFRELRTDLYVGASNQDTRQHVLFGSEGLDHIPISKAVQASLSINPAFSAVEIEGAWYEDGAVTRTSNFVEAIDRGADLVFVLDPFVPSVWKTPGSANERGMLYNIDQDVRALSYTRFANAKACALRRHPEVSTYTFLPNNRLRTLLSANPMDHRPYLEIFRGAYLGTLRRLRHVRHRLSGDLAAHGLSLDMDRADAIAERLERSRRLAFADFFADGRVELRTPPLVGEPQGLRRVG